MFFDRPTTQLLAAPARWRFVSPFTAPLQKLALTGAGAANFKKWMLRNRHTHPFYEVLLAIGGSAPYGIEDAVFNCPPATMVIVGPHQSHAGRYQLTDNDLRHIWVSFITPEQAFLQCVLVHRGRPRRVQGERSLIEVGALSRLLHAIKNLADERTPRRLQIRLLLTAFLAELLNLVIESGNKPSRLIDRNVLLQKKIAMICEHIRKIGGVNTSLADLATLAGYTPAHFARIFKQTTGHTVHQNIDACRLERAKDMLGRNLPLKVMAPELGFSDKTTLSRWLNKYRHALER